MNVFLVHLVIYLCIAYGLSVYFIRPPQRWPLHQNYIFPSPLPVYSFLPSSLFLPPSFSTFLCSSLTPSVEDFQSKPCSTPDPPLSANIHCHTYHSTFHITLLSHYMLHNTHYTKKLPHHTYYLAHYASHTIYHTPHMIPFWKH